MIHDMFMDPKIVSVLYASVKCLVYTLIKLLNGIG